MQRIIVIGGGFAGFWSAIAAAREAHERGGGGAGIAVTLISRDEYLCIRPRLYERQPEDMRVSMLPLLALAGVEFVRAEVQRIDARERRLTATMDGGVRDFEFDRAVLAVGSVAAPPAVPGLGEHGFSVDDYARAARLSAHLRGLGGRPDSAGRFTAVVVGGGFTGLECASELAGWMRDLAASAGREGQEKVVLLDRAPEIGGSLGAGPRAAIASALKDLGIETRVGANLSAVSAEGIELAGGERIPALTVVATAGMRAHELTSGIGAELDPLGRVVVDASLKARDAPVVFAAGDAAAAWADEKHQAFQSCQHAIIMGKVAGANAVRDLIGQALVGYSQPNYVTCLDLGEWGAVFSLGWDRQVAWTGADAKMLKKIINRQWIYPPRAPDQKTLFDAAVPLLAPAADIEASRKFFTGVLAGARAKADAPG